MEKIKRQLGIFKDMECIVTMGLCIALSIVFGKMLAINITNDFRVSLENTPTILAAIAYGPVAGLVVGGLADLLGCLLVGFTINPIITAGAMTVGLFAGIFGRVLLKQPQKGSGFSGYLRCLLTVSIAHLFGSVVIKTYGLYVYFHSPFFLTFFTRFGIYAVTAAVEGFVLYTLYQRQIVQKLKLGSRK